MLTKEEIFQAKIILTLKRQEGIIYDTKEKFGTTDTNLTGP